jgi:hypothetical protein
MNRPTALLALLSLPAAAALADEPPTLTCPQVLEQIAALQAFRPVYKLTTGDERHYINDADRPAELARLQALAAASCSKDPGERASQQAEAERLHVALSPECAVARDELAAMEAPNSRAPADRLGRTRRLVAARCPTVNNRNLWLIQWDGRSDLVPLE